MRLRSLGTVRGVASLGIANKTTQDDLDPSLDALIRSWMRLNAFVEEPDVLSLELYELIDDGLNNACAHFVVLVSWAIVGSPSTGEQVFMNRQEHLSMIKDEAHTLSMLSS